MTKTTFGIPSITRKTPTWAKWLFRSTMIITTVVTFVVASEPAIPDDMKVRIGVYLKGFDMLIFGFSKLFGMKEPDGYQANFKTDNADN